MDINIRKELGHKPHNKEIIKTISKENNNLSSKRLLSKKK